MLGVWKLQYLHVYTCPCSSSCHTPSFYGACAFFTGSAVPVCEQCLILFSLTILVLVAGCWVQFSDDTAYESASYGHYCKSLLIFFPSILLNFLNKSLHLINPVI
jgi:hypothetical protein